VLPKAMDHVNFDNISNIFIERVHKEIKVVQIVEFPAFGNERISENIFERDGICIGGWR
jgi:hypothetical protein